MSSHLLRASCLFAVLGACNDAAPSGPDLRVQVAALDLADVGDACYSLAVRNASTQLVWQADGLCSSRFGDGGGGLAYVATCDASDPGGGAWNTVTLTIDDLYRKVDDGRGPRLTDWVDPCDDGGCTLRTLCEPNADRAVVFDLTIMRSASQGFFDVAVGFEDIFCSAKVDCTDPLVHDPASGKRVDSIVFAFACTDGDPGATIETATHLYMNDLVLVCDGTEYPIDPSKGPGNLYPGGDGAPAPYVQAMTFDGVEHLTNHGQPADKLFWTVALGLDASFFAALPSEASCRLETQATASSGPLPGGATRDGARYPLIDVDVAVFEGGAFVCSEHPLGGEDPHAGVAFGYTPPKPDGTGWASVPFVYQAAPNGDGTLTTSKVGTTPPNPCADIVCSRNSHCAVGVCVCDDGYEGDPLAGCTIIEPPSDCGNGLREPGEACDPGIDSTTVDCAYGAGPCTFCDGSCAWQAGTEHGCGDGTLDAGFETCDPGAVTDADPCGCAGCQYAPPETTCGTLAGDCDAVDHCDGAGSCVPAVIEASAEVECRAANGSGCDIAEHCDGTSTQCPADDGLVAGTVCGNDPPSGACGETSVCEGFGETSTCTARVKPATERCAVSDNECQLDGYCNGTDSACPGVGNASSATPCGEVPATSCLTRATCDGNGSCGTPQVANEGSSCGSGCGASACICDGGTCVDPCADLAAGDNVDSCTYGADVCTCTCDPGYSWDGDACVPAGEWQTEAAPLVGLGFNGESSAGIDGAGNIVVVGESFGQVRYMVYDAANGTWDGPNGLASGSSPKVVVSASGLAEITWYSGTNLVGLARLDLPSSSATLQAIDTVGHVSFSDVALDGNGNGVLLYGIDTSGIEALFVRRLSSDTGHIPNGVGPAYGLDEYTDGRVGSVAVERDGQLLRVTIAYSSFSATGGVLAQSGTLDLGTGNWSWGTAATVWSTFVVDRIEVARSLGKELVTWHGSADYFEVYASWRADGGPWSSGAGVSDEGAYRWDVGQDEIGGVYLARVEQGNPDMWVVVDRVAAGGLEEVFRTVPCFVTGHAFAVAPNGDMTVAYVPEDTREAILVDRSGGVWGAPGSVSPGESPAFDAVALARSEGGQGVALWAVETGCANYDIDMGFCQEPIYDHHLARIVTGP